MRSKQVCASACIALAMTTAGSLHAQEASVTNQGASEVTLPPVVVASPKQRIAQKPRVKPKGAGSAQAGSASGQAEPADGDGTGTEAGLSGNGLPGTAGVFTLGQIDMVGGSAITNDAMWTFSKTTLDQALALAPGVAASNSGGQRNEQLIFVRGFDRWQVPISIDGITIYRPADNRIDFASFLTADISEVQIAKGYTSVLNGPGGMGGAINLVTKKPTKAVEGEVQGGMMFGTDGQYEGYKTYASLGTRQRGYYAQVSGALLDTDGWFLSNDFKPTAVENGGERDHSYKDNWQISAKLGLTPNATDDYSINFVRMNNAKGAPYHITDPVAQQRYWDWPDTTQQNLYWLSHTKLGSSSFVETKAYYTTFQDNLVSYDDPAQTTQSSPKAFISDYDDWAGGGSILLGSDITPWDTLKGMFFYRRDQHDETQAYNIDGASCNSTKPCFQEPKQRDLEDTYSIALENTVHATNRLDIVAGISYDWRKLYKAEEFTAASINPATPASFFEYDKKNSDAFNWQSAIVYRADDFNTWHASVSDRTRFPTIFERFSSRFGGATSNPGLEPERSVNYEVGWTGAFARNSQMSAAVFYSDVTNLIQSVPFICQSCATQKQTQSQNVGDGNFYGVEYSIDYAVSDKLLVGGNVTWLQRDIHNPTNSSFELTGMPRVKGISYLSYKITDAWSITPNVEFASDRWTVKTVNKVNYYYQTGAFALANFQTEYDFNDKTSLMLTARNIFDENYILTDGYPEMGRSFYANMRTQF